MIQTRGLVALIEASDTMLKSASLRFAGYEKSGSGMVSAFFRGSVADCRYGTDCAAAAAQKTGEFLSARVIPAPWSDLDDKLPVK